MKKLLYLGIILILASCGYSTVNVGGREVSTIKIGNLEVMTEDLGEMKWDDAKKACLNLGYGWRLPTKDELNILYENKDNIGSFANDYYISSTENGQSAWGQYFVNGSKGKGRKISTFYVRAVRDF